MDCYLSQLLKMVNELSSIQSIKSAVDTMGETIESLSSTVDTLSSTVDTLNTSLSTMNTTIGTINTNVSTVKDDVSTVKTDVSNTKSKVDEVDSAIQCVKTDIATIDANTSDIPDTLDELQHSIVSNDDKLNDTLVKLDNEDNFVISTVIASVSLSTQTYSYSINLSDYFQLGYQIVKLYTTSAENTETIYEDTEGTYITEDSAYLYLKTRDDTFKEDIGHYHFIAKISRNDTTYSELFDLYIIGCFRNRSKCYILTENQYNLLTNSSTNNPYKLKYPVSIPTSSSE